MLKAGLSNTAATSVVSCFLMNRERQNLIVLNGEVLIEADRAPIKSSRYLHRDDDFYVVVFDGEGLEVEFVFLDCFHNPALDGLFPTKFFSFVMDERIVREAGKNGLHIVLIACIHIILNDSR